MFRKQKSLMLITLMLVGAIMVLPHTVRAPTSGTLALYPGNINVSTTNKTTVLSTWPTFTLQINVTDVTNIYGFALISVHWDPSLFDLLSCTLDTACIFGTTTAPEPDMTGGTTFMGPPGNIKQSDGNMTQTSYSELAHGTYGLHGLNVTSPSWEKVLNLQFNYTGPTPSIGSPIDTDIEIVDEQWVMGGGYKMGTKWGQVPNYPTDNATTAGPFQFAVLGPCHFHYEAEMLPLKKPTASFYVSDPATPPYIECKNVTFNAAASTGGCDGDTDPTAITELHWDFGDGVTEVYKGTNFTYTPKHHYNTTGDMNVTLYVVAPYQGWHDPGYENTSDTVWLIVKISPVLYTYIDVYTENERWPGYVTSYNGTGADVQADAYSPQENVTLFAIVLYNGDVVQNKPVAFYIDGPPTTSPGDQIYLARTAFTNTNGIANTTFRIPWPCTNAEARIFGTWNVTTLVSLAETTLQDTLTFDVGWIVEIISMQTVNGTGDPTSTFKKGECIGIKLSVKNLAKENRSALITIVIYDDVGAVIGRIHINLTIPAHTTTEFLTDFWCSLEIPKWAFVGPNAMAYANAYTSDGGVPWCPEESAGPFTITP